jgi:hypothetical protein
LSVSAASIARLLVVKFGLLFHWSEEEVLRLGLKQVSQLYEEYSQQVAKPVSAVHQPKPGYRLATAEEAIALLKELK